MADEDAVDVVGAGVIGLTCAIELARAGRSVRIIAREPSAATTSAVAAAIWFPHAAGPVDRVVGWGAATLAHFRGLAAAGVPGVVERGGVVCHRHEAPDLSWTAAIDGAHRPARPEELPAGVPAGTWCVLPVIEMDRYLAWLVEQARATGVVFAPPQDLRTLTELRAPTVVVAAGLGARELVGDDTVAALRGQVVRVANPGLTTWLVDGDHPAGLTYVVPRVDDVVLGGTADPGAENCALDAAVETAILERACTLVPALRDAPVLSRAVGLRPVRPTVRLEREDVGGRAIVYCYGHGGAGVTLSWGCAGEVVALCAAVSPSR